MTVPILMYHEVDDVAQVQKRYSLTAQTFDQQLHHLDQRGIETVLLDGLAALDGPSPRVALTFDDSHVSHYATSLPILERHAMRATFFIVTRFIGETAEWLSRVQVEAMARAGMSIQSHSHTHRFLDALSPADVREELHRSKAMIEDWLGKPVTVISCPGGRYDARVLEIAGELGYRAVCTSVPGLPPRAAGRGAVMLPRFLVTSTMPMEEFGRIVAADPQYIRRRRSAYRLKYAAKRVLGNQLYHALWQRLSKHNAGVNAEEH